MISGKEDLKKIRQAVGAIVFQKNRYLLVNKIQSVSSQEILYDHWDFPKGAIEKSDASPQEAILRELFEETGSSNYHFLYQYPDIIKFDFPDSHVYSGQETSIFLAEFLGDEKELKVDGYEIAEVKFVLKEEFLSKIRLKETLEFLDKNKW